jgi:hypothetical protein
MNLRSLLEQTFTVETIMTPKHGWLVLEQGKLPDEKLHKADEANIDTLPVLTKNGEVCALFNRLSAEEVPLSPSWIVSRDTSIAEILKLFVEKQKSCFVVLHRLELIGLVTPADLNKLPARTYFYNLIAELEIELVELIRVHFAGREDDLMQHIDQEGRDKLQKKVEKSQHELDIFHVLNLSDIVNLIGVVEELRQALQVSSKSAFDKYLGGLVHFRNDIMHLNNVLLTNALGIDSLYKRINRTINALERIP